MDKNQVTTAMIDYYKGDPKRIQHFLKVHAYAKLIGEQEGLDKKTLDILEVAALTHDIGIKISEEKYNSSAGKYQEIEGPTIAQKMLKDLQYDKTKIERVCYLIGHHHTYGSNRWNRLSDSCRSRFPCKSCGRTKFQRDN